MKPPDLNEFVRPGSRIALRVTPKASRNRIVADAVLLRVYVTTAPEDGKANAAVGKVLAKALGKPRSRLKLLRGQSSRDKLFEVLPG